MRKSVEELTGLVRSNHEQLQMMTNWFNAIFQLQYAPTSQPQQLPTPLPQPAPAPQPQPVPVPPTGLGQPHQDTTSTVIEESGTREEDPASKRVCLGNEADLDESNLAMEPGDLPPHGGDVT